MDDVDFFFQVGNLKRTPRSGWLSIGIKDCESVAEHSFRAALIAYLLAKEEGLGENEAKGVAMAVLLHDVHEARVGDLTKLSRKYVKIDEKMAVAESLGPFAGLATERGGKVADIVRDADLLEMFFQAKEYMDEGNAYAKEWLAPKKLKTEAAKRLYSKMMKRDSRAWLLGAVEW